MDRCAPAYVFELPDRQLACAPISSQEGQNYLGAMWCAINYAFANRQVIAHHTREAFANAVRMNQEEIRLRTRKKAKQLVGGRHIAEELLENVSSSGALRFARSMKKSRRPTRMSRRWSRRARWPAYRRKSPDSSRSARSRGSGSSFSPTRGRVVVRQHLSSACANIR